MNEDDHARLSAGLTGALRRPWKPTEAPRDEAAGLVRRTSERLTRPVTRRPC